MKREVNWYQVRELMRKSFTGRGLSDEEQKIVAAAYRSDPGRYKGESKDVMAEERAAINPLAKWK